ncbi:MAG: MFS transporter [Bacteroidales bacterium]|jgi:MFS family permease
MQLGKKFNYGYIIVFSCFIMSFIYLGLGNITQNLYVVPVTEYFGFARSEYSFIFSIIAIVGIVANLSYDKIYKSMGIRFMVGSGTLLFAAGYFIYYKASSLPAFYLGASFLGIGLVYTSTLTFSMLINSWFTENKGLILGLIFAGSGLGGAVFSPVVAKIITNYGYNRSYLIGSIIFLILSIPVTLMVKEPTVPITDMEISKSDNILTTKKTTGELLKEPCIIAALFCLFMFGFLIAPFLHITPAHMTDRNFDYIFASEVSGVIMLILAFAKVFLGVVNDRFNIKVSMSIGLITFIISSILLFFMTNKLIAWLYAISYGFALATLSVLIPLFVLAVSGEEYFSNLIGISVSLMSAGAAAGTPAMSLSYDFTGSYDLVLIVFAVLGTITYVITMKTIKKSSELINNSSLVLSED